VACVVFVESSEDESNWASMHRQSHSPPCMLGPTVVTSSKARLHPSLTRNMRSSAIQGGIQLQARRVEQRWQALQKGCKMNSRMRKRRAFLISFKISGDINPRAETTREERQRGEEAQKGVPEQCSMLMAAPHQQLQQKLSGISS
jgi:hypothetical protein